MDDKPEYGMRESKQQSAERNRTSIVERAAGKMAARSESAFRNTANSGPEAEALQAENGSPEHNSLLPERPGTSHGQNHERFLEGSTTDAALNDLSAADVKLGTPREGTRRKSRTVELDLHALQANHIISPGAKRSRTVEEFRLIKRVILSRRWDENDQPGNAIVVTSALPSEGKTTTAVNLAMSIAAEEDLRVLLIDADFIKPDALRKLGVNANRGLIDVIQNPQLDISDVILRTNVEKLSLIPAGQLHDRCTELLASSRMDALITELASRYEDRILIFDSPPLLATTESVVLASHMGQVVFVVQAGRTKRDSVDSALEMLGQSKGLGIVLNRTQLR